MGIRVTLTPEILTIWMCLLLPYPLPILICTYQPHASFSPLFHPQSVPLSPTLTTLPLFLCTLAVFQPPTPNP